MESSEGGNGDGRERDQAVMAAGWTRVGEREWVRVEQPCSVNLGLILGEERALVIDTGAGPRSAGRHLEAIRLLTELPLVAVNTHHHHDHALGNHAFAGAGVTEFWAHQGTIDALDQYGEAQRALLTQEDGEPEMLAASGPGTRVLPPTHAVTGSPVDLDLGGHQVTLMHLGRAHTAGDVVVASGPILFAGDIVEQGGHPQFEDAYPDEWLRVLGKIIAIDELYQSIVPGHGTTVGADEVRAHYHRLARAIQVADTALNEHESDATKSIPVLPFGPVQSRHLLNRLRQTRAAAGGRR